MDILTASPIGLTFLAGSATIIGGVIGVIASAAGEKICRLCFGLSAGVMLATSLLELLPHAIDDIVIFMPGIAGGAAAISAFLAGVFLAKLLEGFICHHNTLCPQGEKNIAVAFASMGIFSAAALLAHNIPEGMAVFLTASHDPSLGKSLTLAIALHNLPEGIAIAVPLAFGGKSKLFPIALTVVCALGEPFGALLAKLWLMPLLDTSWIALIYCSVAGLMCGVCFYELLPAALTKKHVPLGGTGTIIGILIIFLAECLG